MADHRDFPYAQIRTLANRTIAKYTALGAKAEVHFKYTCRHCGSRQTFAEPNQLYKDGECSACGKTTKNIQGYGFLLAVEMPAGKDGRSENVDTNGGGTEGTGAADRSPEDPADS